MRSLQFCIRSAMSFIKQERVLAFWIYTGMGFASFMILICSGDYFTKRTNSVQEQLQNNKCVFVLDNSVEQMSQLIKDLEENDAVENICIEVNLADDVWIEAWSYPERAFIKETIISGRFPDALLEEEWCIISQNYQWEKQMKEEEVPLVNKYLWLYDMKYYCVAVTTSNNYDILISMESMEKLFRAEDNTTDIVESRVSYIYNDTISEIVLERMNSSIIDAYHPTMVIRGERAKTYSFFSYVRDMGSLILLMFLAVVNYSIIYDYWIKKRYHTYQIFRMCGLSASAMVGMVFFEQIVHLILMHGIVSVIYILVSITVFHPVIENLPILTTQCVFAGGVLLAINLLIFIIIGIRTGKISILEMYKGGE